MKHVNIVQNISPDRTPAPPAARTAAQASRRRFHTRIPAIATAANRLRQNAASKPCARSRTRVTTPAVLQRTLAATISVAARAWVIGRASRIVGR